VLLGLMGETPQDVDPPASTSNWRRPKRSGQLKLLGSHVVPFRRADHLLFHMAESLAEHPNGMRFTADPQDGSSTSKVYYSVGGGFIRAEGEQAAAPAMAAPRRPGLPFDTMAQLLAHGERSGLSIPQMLRANENVRYSDAELDAGMDRIWQVMRDCIAHGLSTPGQLPGGLNVKRRAAKLWQQANDKSAAAAVNDLPHDALHQVSLYAMAVNEENAAGGRVVTAPTNGAAGIIPAVLRYYAEDCKPSRSVTGVRNFLLTAGHRHAVQTQCLDFGAEIGCRVRSAWPVPWQQRVWWRHWAAATSRSRMRPKSASSTIWA
jgi:L-serine dehydratase